MFTCLPGAMLLLRHILECSKGSSCERALLNDTFATAESHSWFNQAPPEALLLYEMATTRPGPNIRVVFNRNAVVKVALIVSTATRCVPKRVRHLRRP